MKKVKHIFMVTLTVLVLASCSDEGDKTIATVNDAKITQGQLNDALMKQYGDEVLESLMTKEIVKQESEKLKIKVSDDEIKEEYDSYVQKYGDENTFIESIKRYKMTKEDVMDDIKNYLLTVKLLEKDIKITDEDLKAYYEENKEYYTLDDDKQLSFEEAKEQVLDDLKEDRINERYETWLDEKFEEYDVKTYFK